jgi:hypothetical protein
LLAVFHALDDVALVVIHGFQAAEAVVVVIGIAVLRIAFSRRADQRFVDHMGNIGIHRRDPQFIED